VRRIATPVSTCARSGAIAFRIIGVISAKAGWLFVAAEGAIARADSFLGAHVFLGHVPLPATS
jgi:hypothetical protein